MFVEVSISSCIFSLEVLRCLYVGLQMCLPERFSVHVFEYIYLLFVLECMHASVYGFQPSAASALIGQFACGQVAQEEAGQEPANLNPPMH